MRLLILSELANFKKALNDGKLFLLSLIPILLSALIEIILFGILLYFSISKILDIKWSDYMSYIFPILTLTIAMGVIYISITSFYALVFTIGAPFHDIVSERIEKLRNGKVDNKDFRSAVILGMKFGSSYFILSLIIIVINFILSILPGIGNVIGVISSILLGGYAISLGVLSMTFTRHGLQFKEIFQISKKYWREVLILGVVMQLVNYVPLVNILVFPLFIIWGTLVALKIIEIEN